MISFPNAKINLGLNVVGVRSDGYHNLETVFYPISLCDALEIVPAKRLSLTTLGLPVEGDWEKNLVVRAFRLLQDDFGIPEVAIVLQKNIPMGAGLGGGSSDAAFMLKMLNEQFALHLTNEQLEQYASQLGADCAFFVQNKPVFAEGIGNEFSPISLSLKGWHVVLIKPDTHISTAEAYRGVKCVAPDVRLREALQRPMAAWKDCVRNDFEASVFPLHPELGEIKQWLYDSGAVYAAMSGSGSTIYGIFQSDAQLSENQEFSGCPCRVYNMVLE